MFYTFTPKEHIRQNGKEWGPVRTTLNFNAPVYTEHTGLPPRLILAPGSAGLGRLTAAYGSARLKLMARLLVSLVCACSAGLHSLLAGPVCVSRKHCCFSLYVRVHRPAPSSSLPLRLNRTGFQSQDCLRCAPSKLTGGTWTR